MRSIMLLLVLAVAATVLAMSSPARGVAPVLAQESSCPEGALVINASGAFICAVRAENISLAFASIVVVQQGSSANVTLFCMYADGCSATVYAYDVYNSSLSQVAVQQVGIGAGESRMLSFSGFKGLAVFRIVVNGVDMGYYIAPQAQVPQIASALSNIASMHTMLAILAGLLVVSVPLGWALQREWGLAGLALVGAANLIYLFVSLLTGNPLVALLVATLGVIIGVIYMVAGGAQV
jgi:hypothetical protein